MWFRKRSGARLMSSKAKTVLGYVIAVVVPVAMASAWGVMSSELQRPALFLLAIALIARFSGFGPALAFTFLSSLLLWFYVLPFATTEPAYLVFREVLYVVAALTIASISRQKSEEVREAEERYRSLVEMSPDGIGVNDEDGTILFANSALARMLGRSKSELVGKNILDFVEDVERGAGRIASVRAGKDVGWVTSRWIRADGSLVDIEATAVAVPYQGKRRLHGFIRDLTERKKAEAKLDESRRRLQALFDTAIDPIIFFDSDGKCVDANPAASVLLGFSHDEFLQQEVADLCARHDDVSKSFLRVVSGGPGSGEAVLRRKDGSSCEIEYRAVANVVPNVHVALLHDITARKTAERSLEELSGKLLRLQDDERRRIAQALHDTTAQSLVAIRLNLNRVARSAVVADPRVKAAIEDSIALADRSIAEVRTLSYVLHPPMIDEIGLIPSLRWFVRGFEERSGIRVTLNLPEDIERFSPDIETAVFRIVQEALTNIQRHSGSSLARIKLAKNAGEINLVVEDDGRGIPAHLRDQKDAILSAGVGIAGIRQRIRELGGQMHIESEDHGTRLIVKLPTAATSP